MNTQRKCVIKGCTKDATCGIAINVPALNCPVPEHDPIHITIGMTVCDDCLPTVKPTDFISPQLRTIVKVQAAGRATPDFDRAFISRVEFTSTEWVTLTKNWKQ